MSTPHHRRVHAHGSSETADHFASSNSEKRDHKKKFIKGTAHVQVRIRFLSDRTLTGDQFRLLIAIDSFVFGGDKTFPGNAKLARYCGWYLPSGKPNVRFVQRELKKLEDKGRIRRFTSVHDGATRRDDIVLLGIRPNDEGELAEDASILTYPTSILTYPTSNQTPGHVDSDAEVRQNGHGGTSKPTPELEEGEADPTRRSNPITFHQADPAKEVRDLIPVQEHNRSLMMTNEMRLEWSRLEQAARSGIAQGVQGLGMVSLIKDCANWLRSHYRPEVSGDMLADTLAAYWHGRTLKVQGVRWQVACQLKAAGIDLSPVTIRAKKSAAQIIAMAPTRLSREKIKEFEELAKAVMQQGLRGHHATRWELRRCTEWCVMNCPEPQGRTSSAASGLYTRAMSGVWFKKQGSPDGVQHLLECGIDLHSLCTLP